MNWQELTTTDFAAIDRSTAVVLPTAAIEQHGPHLPLATDRMIVEHFAQRLNQQLGEGVLVLPTVAVGCSSHHMQFAGSLTLSHETFLDVLLQYLSSAYHHGFRRFLILNAHGGNQGIGQVALERFGQEHPAALVVMTSWWRLGREELLKLNESGAGGVGHAGEFETSLMLLIDGSRVRRDQLPQRSNRPTFAWAEADLLRAPQASLYRTMQQMTPSGTYGEPTAGSAEKGQRISDVVTSGLVELVSDLAAATLSE